MKPLVVFLFVVGILAGQAAADWDDDYGHIPRKAMLLHKGKDKSTLLKVSITLDEHEYKSCPSSSDSMDDLREFVANSFATMLHRAHVQAKFKTGVLGCEAELDHHGECVKVTVQFVVKLHAKKGCDRLPKFVEIISTTNYSHRAICDIQELECSAHSVSCIEVEPLSKKPHGTSMIKYKSDEKSEEVEEPDVEHMWDDEGDWHYVDDDNQSPDDTVWIHKSHLTKKHAKHAKYAAGKKEHEYGDGSSDGYSGSSSDGGDSSDWEEDSEGDGWEDGEDESDSNSSDNGGSGNNSGSYGSSSGGSYGNGGGYHHKSAHAAYTASRVAAARAAPTATAAAAAPKHESIGLDPRLWPELRPSAPRMSGPAAAAAAAHAAAAATATAAAAQPQQPLQVIRSGAGIDSRLWPEYQPLNFETAAATAGAVPEVTTASTAAVAQPLHHRMAVFDTRLWPDTMRMPWASRASPMA